MKVSYTLFVKNIIIFKAWLLLIYSEITIITPSYSEPHKDIP